MLTETSYETSAKTSFSAALPSTTATALKRQGWPSIMANVRRKGHLLITNHNLPEAVILPPEEYDKLVEAAQKAQKNFDPTLEELTQKFAERLHCLQELGANEKLATLMLKPLDLGGRVRAGEDY